MMYLTSCTTHHEKQTSTADTIKPQHLSAPEIEETLIKDPNQNNQQPTTTKPVKIDNGSIVNAATVDCLIGIVLDEECDFKNGIKIQKDTTHPAH